MMTLEELRDLIEKAMKGGMGDRPVVIGTNDDSEVVDIEGGEWKHVTFEGEPDGAFVLTVHTDSVAGRLMTQEEIEEATGGDGQPDEQQEWADFNSDC